ncbi:MAG: putative toxin-antitoxin system toxin component, PIN family [Gammaproteobacteria bacterium]
MRVVFDTNVILSALRFQAGRLAWLRAHWAARVVDALASKEVTAELIAVLAYPKFELTSRQIQDLLSDYLPYVRLIDVVVTGTPRCRDPDDQKFVDLAIAGNADVLVTGDRDLLAMKGDVAFAIETPEEYARRF